MGDQAADGLTYYIHEGLLEGSIGKEKFSIDAVSGGRAGSKTPGAVNFRVANNPLAVCRKLDEGEGIEGGPLPPGGYTAKPHPKHDNWIRLEPDASNAMCNRSGFAIHGRGKRGSDGCIVPNNYNDLLRLMKAVKKVGSVHLDVKDSKFPYLEDWILGPARAPGTIK